LEYNIDRPCSILGRSTIHTEFLSGNLDRGDHLEHLCIDEMIRLKYTLKKYDMGVWTG
jgi:hypothetical protein